MAGLLLSLLAVTCNALTLQRESATSRQSSSFNFLKYRAVLDKSPGGPPISHWKNNPYKTHHQEREQWGERLLKAAKPVSAVAEGKCDGILHFSGYTWCENLMPKEVTWEKRELYGDKVLAQTSFSAEKFERREHGANFLGISYGIRERDVWSEALSMRYLMPTKLKDCFIRTNEGPMGPDNLVVAFPPPADCRGFKAAPRICYGAKYEAEVTCLNEVDTQFIGRDGNLTFESLQTSLRDRKPLSTFLKVDIEGSEWDVLQQLVNDDEMIGKIRVLDMEAHMNKYVSGGHAHPPHDFMEKKVSIMEKLAEKFAVIGTDIPFFHTTLEQNLIEKTKKDASYKADEPLVYAKNGYSLDQYMISFANKKLVNEL